MTYDTLSSIQTDFNRGLPASFNGYVKEYDRVYYSNLCNLGISKKLFILKMYRKYYMWIDYGYNIIKRCKDVSLCLIGKYKTNDNYLQRI